MHQLFRFFAELLQTADFMPRRLCGAWTPGLIALHRWSDRAIFLAFLVIPVLLLRYFWRRQSDLKQFRALIATFTLFLLASGSLHLIDSFAFEMPMYRIGGLVKLVTALAACGAVVCLIRSAPVLASLRSPFQAEREITERVRELEHTNGLLTEAAEERKRLAETLAEQNRLRNEWLAMLAHELRNPLAPILNSMAIMRARGSQDENLESQRQLVERQVRTMGELLNDLLDVSRVERGKIILNKRLVSLCSVVMGALEAMQPYIALREHELNVEYPERDIEIEADPIRLEQVIVNLLSNAAKYTNPHGRITLAIRPHPNGWTTVTVRDNGIGIKKAMLPRVFDLFAQEERSLDRSQGGLGIGLTLVKAITELHGGRVEVYSAGRSQGSEFQVWLPMVQEIEVSESPHDPPQPNLPPRPASSSRVLIVDDNRDAAQTLRDLCELWGHQAECAYDGWSALQLVKDQLFDSILLDIGLPGMDGFEVARRIRQDPEYQQVLLIAVTGYGNRDDRDRAHRAGFNRHLLKPVDPDTLRKVLEVSETDAALAEVATP